MNVSRSLPELCELSPRRNLSSDAGGGGGGIARTLSSLLFFFERRQRNQSVNSFTALLSPNRLHTALAPTSVTCANQSSLMLCVLSVRSRDNLVGGTE